MNYDPPIDLPYINRKKEITFNHEIEPQIRDSEVGIKFLGCAVMCVLTGKDDYIEKVIYKPSLRRSFTTQLSFKYSLSFKLASGIIIDNMDHLQFYISDNDDSLESYDTRFFQIYNGILYEKLNKTFMSDLYQTNGTYLTYFGKKVKVDTENIKIKYDNEFIALDEYIKLIK